MTHHIKIYTTLLSTKYIELKTCGIQIRNTGHRSFKLKVLETLESKLELDRIALNNNKPFTKKRKKGIHMYIARKMNTPTRKEKWKQKGRDGKGYGTERPLRRPSSHVVPWEGRVRYTNVSLSTSRLDNGAPITAEVVGTTSSRKKGK